MTINPLIIIINACAFQKILSVIEYYLNCLDRIDEDEYVLNEEKIPQDCHNPQLIKCLQLHHIIIILHYLLNLEGKGRQASVRLFTHSEINPEFLNYLQKTLINLTI